MTSNGNAFLMCGWIFSWSISQIDLVTFISKMSSTFWTFASDLDIASFLYPWNMLFVFICDLTFVFMIKESDIISRALSKVSQILSISGKPIWGFEYKKIIYWKLSLDAIIPPTPLWLNVIFIMHAMVSNRHHLLFFLQPFNQFTPWFFSSCFPPVCPGECLISCIL